MADLKPCPFCGGEPSVRVPGETDGFAVHVRCRCGAELYGAKAHFGDSDDAIAAWNTRTAERAGGGVDDTDRLDWLAMRGRSVRSLHGRNKTLVRWAACMPEDVADPRINLRAVIDAALRADGEGRDHG